MAQVLIAEKHSSAYLIHKYWSRKPANVIRTLVEQYTRPGDLVLDPFCGSGVTLVEAVRLDRRAIGIDLNPTAALLSAVSTRLHDLTAIRRAWTSLLEAWTPICSKAYAGERDEQVRHCVQTPVLECPPLRRNRPGRSVPETRQPLPLSSLRSPFEHEHRPCGRDRRHRRPVRVRRAGARRVARRPADGGFGPFVLQRGGMESVRRTGASQHADSRLPGHDDREAVHAAKLLAARGIRPACA